MRAVSLRRPAHVNEQRERQARTAYSAEDKMEQIDGVEIEADIPEDVPEETEIEAAAEAEAAGAEDDNGEDGDGEGEDAEDEGDDEELGQRAQKRIKKLVGAKKDAERRISELEQELEEAKKLGGDDGKAYIAAAEKAGILPTLMTKDLANGLEELARKESALDYLSNKLDSDDEEFEIGEQTYSRRQVERQERRLKDAVADLRERFGGKRKDLQKKVRDIFELGMKAQKAGWKPGEKAPTQKKKTLETPERGKAPAKAQRAGGDYREVETEDDLDEMIIAEMRRRKK